MSELTTTQEQAASARASGLSYVSPTMQRLPKSRRPSPSTLCEACPASVWYVTPKQMRCFCRVMHLMSWRDDEPHEIQECDGYEMAMADREAKLREA